MPNINAAGNGNICTESGLTQVTLLYPTANANGIVLASGVVQLGGAPTAAQINAALAADGYQTAAVAGGIQFRVTGGTGAPTCAFDYTAPAALGQAPTITAINSAGC